MGAVSTRTSFVLISTQKQFKTGRIKPSSPLILTKNTVLTQDPNVTITERPTPMLAMLAFFLVSLSSLGLNARSLLTQDQRTLI